MKHQELFNKVTAIIAEKSILKHPFYLAWQKGLLKKEELQDYMKQYYHLESAFPRFQSGIHANCGDNEMRKVMLKDLVGEEGPETNHVDQLITFSAALGVSKEELENSPANQNTLKAIDTILGLTQDKNINKGLAALATYKEQIRAVAETKEHGLKEFYGIEAPEALQFFRTHAKKNVAWHELLDNNVTPADYDNVTTATGSLCDAWWSYLDGVTTPDMCERAGMTA
ncbi:MAG: iron-containing redox enzyme family protein [Candidatus Pacebacteria bacterium]|nr:iron-containing redox enzyme family protein [Candidatus Paceibacterota bacterium]